MNNSSENTQPFFLFNEWCIFRWVLLRQQNSNFTESQSIMTEKQTVKTLSPLTTKDETAVHCETVTYSCTVKTRITPQLPILGKRELLWLTSGVYMDRSLCLFRSSLGFCAFLKGNLKIVARCKETIYPNLSLSISFPLLSTRNVSFSLIALVLSSWHTHSRQLKELLCESLPCSYHTTDHRCLSGEIGHSLIFQSHTTD